MPLQIDFAVAVGLFLIFIGALFIYLTGYTTRHSGLISTSELRTFAYELYKLLFGSKGVPENWEKYGDTPVKIGLITELYRIPVVVKEMSGTDRGMTTISLSLSFDPRCENKTWNSTVRVYENGEEVTSQLYNQSFCFEKYVNSSDIIFSSNFLANQNKTFFVYFSGEKLVAPPNYSLSFEGSSNFTIQVFPEENLPTISISKLNKLRGLEYEEVVKTVGAEYEFNIEISE